MSIEEFIKVLEEDYIQEDMDSLTPKDRILIWLNAKEFMRSRLMRSGAIPVEETENNKKIFIKIADGDSRNTDIQQDTQQE